MAQVVNGGPVRQPLDGLDGGAIRLDRKHQT